MAETGTLPACGEDSAVCPLDADTCAVLASRSGAREQTCHCLQHGKETWERRVCRMKGTTWS